MTTSLGPQISALLLTNKSLVPTPTWLTSFLSTQRPATPLTALYQTALFRLLASDITTSLSPLPPNTFPPDIHNIDLQSRHLQSPIVVQVLDIEDMSKSRWEQIEAIEALERGEGTKGREIVRVVAAVEGSDDLVAAGRAGGPHKLLLQDARGVRVYGIELKEVEGVGLVMSIGCKLVLRGVSVARGVVLLEPRTATLLGGKIDALHEGWREGRKTSLKAAIEASERERV
ncbi:hypothetical protein MMC26_004409 [Xylographa opegraphella]|nr:hypothetical protein [Xylographa opegraphella]